MLRAFCLVSLFFLCVVSEAGGRGVERNGEALWRCMETTSSSLCKNGTITSGFELPPEGDYLNRRRSIGAGRILKDDGSTEVQLIAVGYRWSRDFHKKIHFPNKVCAFFVFPKNEKQKEIIQKAISAFENGHKPTSNSAYQFAMEHRWREDDCMAVKAESDQRFLVSGSKAYKLAYKNGELFFYADQWVESGALFFRSGS